MKTKSVLVMLIAFLIASVLNAFSLNYSNRDSKTYKWDVKLNGTTRTIEFRSGTSGSASVSMSASSAKIKTNCGWVELKSGSKITIKNGCIK